MGGCTGNSEIFKATFRRREVIYPQLFGAMTAGGDKDYTVNHPYSNIQGYAAGAKGLADPSLDMVIFLLSMQKHLGDTKTRRK